MRYLPLTDQNRKEMLEAIGVSKVDDLFVDVPKQAFVKGHVDLPKQKSELEVERIIAVERPLFHEQSKVERWSLAG